VGRGKNIPQKLFEHLMLRYRILDDLQATDSQVDDTGCRMLHVDMDAFYAAVEIRDRPELVDLPVIVGRLGNRGVVAAANYQARTFGVHSAMPMALARRLAPHAAFISPNFGKYQAVSRGVMAIFHEITPLAGWVCLRRKLRL
jgi:DNA polymerase-4